VICEHRQDNRIPKQIQDTRPKRSRHEDKDMCLFLDTNVFMCINMCVCKSAWQPQQVVNNVMVMFQF